MKALARKASKLAIYGAAGLCAQKSSASDKILKFYRSSSLAAKIGAGGLVCATPLALKLGAGVALKFAARKILKQNGVRALISVGGYSSAPASIAAILSRVPFFIHEQNAVCGRLNRLLRPFARAFYSSYEKPAFAYPIADIFFETARQRTALKRVIFLGGSQGASFINSLAVELAPKLLSLGYGVIHQCGEREFERISQIYAQQGLDVQLVGFCKNMHELIASADLCVGRSGASTLWELCANGLPAIFVPFPFAAADHQFYNA